MSLGVGIFGSLVTRPEIPTWYATLNKDTAAIGISNRLDRSLRVDGRQLLEALGERIGISSGSKAISLFTGQLALNAAWSPVIFEWHGTDGPCYNNGTFAYYRRDDRVRITCRRCGGLVLAPYLAWVVYASTIISEAERNGALIRRGRAYASRRREVVSIQSATHALRGLSKIYLALWEGPALI